MRLVMMVLLTYPVAVVLSTWIGDQGCGQPISVKALRSGTISWLGRMMSYTLAETPNFVCVGLVPRGLAFWEPPELPVFGCFSGVVVNHRVGSCFRLHVIVNVVVLVIS